MHLALSVALCLGFPIGCLGIVGRDGSGRMLGQNVGTSVAASSNQLKVSQNSADGGGEVFQDVVANSLRAHQNVLINPGVQQVIEETNSLAASRPLLEDPICARRWSRLCPDGWDVMADSSCSAPSSYQGGCASLQNFAEAGRVEQNQFMETCGAPWPCEDLCEGGHEYADCPLGWEELGSGLCILSAEPPTCMGVYKFDVMSVREKQELSLVCGIKWTCKSPCQSDYSAACPDGWSNQQGVCMAPLTYGGVCADRINTTGMDFEQKQDLAKNCKVRFPCAREHEHGEKQLQEILGDVLIPNGPVEFGTGRFSPPRKLERTAEKLAFADRFYTPSGPIDTEGSIHF